MKQKSFVQGAAILGLAALVSKTLGGIYRIPYQNIVGNEGLALFNLVYPMYSTLLVLSTLGFPIAVSKFVAERLAKGDLYGAERVFRVSFVIMVLTGCLSFSLLFFGADTLARMIGDPGTVLAIKSISFALLLVPMISVIRGYFQGWQNMMPTAISQVFEQIVRVITILVLSFILIKTSVELAAAGAVLGAFTGAILSIAILGYYYWRHRSVVNIEKQRLREIGSNKHKQEPLMLLLKRLTLYSLPICFGMLVLPLFNLADTYTVINILTSSGVERLDARYTFGVYSKALPLVQISALFATALSLALIPSISEAKSLKQDEVIKRRTSFALRLTAMVGLPAAFGLSVLAKPINIALFNETIGTEIIMILAFATIFSTLEITTTGILQGLGESKAPAINLFIGFIFKVVLNIALIIVIGINGAAIATIVAYFIALVLNMRDLKKHTRLEYNWLDIAIKPILAAIIMAVTVYGTVLISTPVFESLVSLRSAQALVSTVGVVVGVLVYGVALLVTKSIAVDELVLIPKIGQTIKRIVERLQIYKR